MGKVLEQHAKALLARSGIAIPRGEAAASPEEARQIAERIGGPVVVKALVLAGKRGKAGAVRLAESPDESARAAADLLGSDVGGYPVEAVLVEQRIAISRELYLSLTIDANAACTRLLISTSGGIEIEEIVHDNPDALQSHAIAPSAGLPEFQARQLWRRAGISGRLLPRLGALTARLYRAFRDFDAYLLEINPLAETVNGEMIALGAVLAIDDAALFRQPTLDGLVQVASEKVWRPLTTREEQVNALNAAEPYRGSARYLELDGGDIGFLCGGGGASLVLFDSLVRAGGQPANYAEFGGNPTETKVAGLARVVLSKPGVRGLFVAHNITNNTQVDVVARGVVRALEEAGISTDRFPVVAREIGLHDAEGQAIFEAAGIRSFGIESTLSDAARGMVAAIQAREERVSS
jgi:succinyl-CoA synthetase beta subunit/citryl-CoA synthetase large subunit